MSLNILELNNNSTREAKYKLRIINGEDAIVWSENGDLMYNNYWKDFISSTDTYELPILSINSMVKSQSIWYRNKNIQDYCEITVSNDYNNNIIEFLNRGVKNFELNYDSLDQLIFVIDVKYINTLGGLTNQPLFVGRPTISSYNDKHLKFRVDSLESVLKASSFANNVLKYPTNAFHGFLTLKQGFEYIFNNPRGNYDSDFTYPTTPFRINSETYLPQEDEPFLQENDIIPSSYNIYAEDSISNDSSNRKQIFYYRDTPECGFIDALYDDNGNLLSVIDTTNLSELRFYTNPTELSGVDSSSGTYPHRLITENIFRTFRPIKSFIATESMSNMKVATINGKNVEFQDANDEAFSLDIGDEIIIMEQKVDINKVRDSDDWKSLLFSTCTNNVMYFNRSKNIMYWNAILTQVCSPPLPSIFYDLRLDGYFSLMIEWDLHYWTSQIGGDASSDYKKRRYYPKNDIALNSTTLGFPDNIRLSRLAPNTAYIEYSISLDLNLGYNGNTKRVYYPSDDIPLDLYWVTERQSTVLPKNIRFVNNKLIYAYHSVSNLNINFQGSGGKFTLAEKSVYNATDIWETYNEVENPSIFNSGYVVEIPPFEDTSIVAYGSYHISIEFQTTNVTEYMRTQFMSGGTNFYNGLGQYDLLTGNNINVAQMIKRTFNYDFNNGNIYLFNHTIYATGNDTNLVYRFDGTHFFTDKTLTVGSFPLDVNVELDKIMYLDENGYFVYANYSDLSIIYQGIFTAYDKYLASDRRESFSFTNPSNNNLVNIESNFKQPIKLLDYKGYRYNAFVGLCNSFFKNSYNDNWGIKNIGFNTEGSVLLNDSQYNIRSVKMEKYNKLEYEKYFEKKNDFTDVDNETSDTQEESELNYDEALSINMYSTTDTQFSIKLHRTDTEIEWTVTSFVGVSESGTIIPPNYQAFELPLTGVFNGITIQVNFVDSTLEVGKTFRGNLDRRELIVDKVKDKVESTNNKHVWKDKTAMGLKFPFLMNKYSKFFNDKLSDYWTDELGNIRKILEVDIEIPELILLDTDYSIFNIGRKRITIDSDRFYLNGYGLYKDVSLIPLNNNRCSFYIEKAILDFDNKTTKFTLVSV